MVLQTIFDYSSALIPPSGAKLAMKQNNNKNSSGKQSANSRNGNKTQSKKLTVVKRSNYQKGTGVRNDYGGQLISTMQKGYGATLRMYPTTLAFAKVYLDPFSLLEARLPLLPIYSTKCIRTYASGTGAIGTNTFGFITTIPMNGIVNNNLSVYYSSSAFTGVSISRVAGGVLSTAATKTPYLASSFDPGVVNGNALGGRIVAYGIRIKNTTTVLQSSGEWFACQMNPKSSMDAFDSGTIKKIQGFKQDTFRDPSFHVYNRMITSRNDAEFLAWNTTSATWNLINPGASSDENINYLSCAVVGVPGSTFDFEVVGHYEIIGPNLDVEEVSPIDEGSTHEIVNEGTKKRHRNTTQEDHVSPVKKNEDEVSKFTNFMKGVAKTAIPVLGDFVGMPSLAKKITDMIN